MNISPEVGSSKPASMRSSVVFPQPEGPSNEKNSPAPMSRLTLSTARTPPNCFDMLVIEIRESGRLMMLHSNPVLLGSVLRRQAATTDPFREHHHHDGADQNGAAERQHTRQQLGKAKLAEDEYGQGHLRPAQKRSHEVFVEGCAEAEQQARHDSGPGEGKCDAPEGLPGTVAEIGARLLETAVEPLEP